VTEDADLIAGRYRLLEEVGSGGMGVVWRAKDEVLGRIVAVKALAVRSVISGSGAAGRNDESSRRAMREARIAARLHHPNVIGVYDIVEHEHRPFLVMEFLASRSLSELAASGVMLPPAEAARIGAQLAAGLNAAHSAGIVHRDVKPGNVLLAQDGTVKLTDFGISRAVGDTTVTASGILLGTLSYIAPEVGRGLPADQRSDVYSLGATLYAAVEGQPPFGTDDNAIALLYRIVHEEITPPRNAGPLAPVLLRMLERDPIARPTMTQVQRMLEAIENAQDKRPVIDIAAAVPVAEPTPTLVDEVPAMPDAAAKAAAPGAGSETVADAVASAAAVSEAAVSEAAASQSASGADTASELESTTAAADDATQLPASAPTPTPPLPEEAARIAFERRRRILAVGLVAALLVIIGAIVLAEELGHNAPAGSPAAAASHTTAPASASASPVASRSPSHSPSAQATPPQSQNTTKSSASPSSAASQSVASQLSSTIIDYYKLVPGDLNDGWGWMTAGYQTNHAGGRSGYTSFWAQIQRVTVSGVVAQPPSTVVATIDYYYKDGTIVEERTSFGMVFQQGRWKIDSSSVLSHSSR